MTEIKAVCFDGFEAIVQIAREHRPFEAIFKNGPGVVGSRLALTRKMNLRDVAREFSIQIDPQELAGLEAKLHEECASTRLRPGMDIVWAALRQLKMKIGVCSNLAAPYEQSLLACLPGIPDALVLSFDIGVIKPEREFFQHVIVELQLDPSEILFVGSDCDGGIRGASRAGMYVLTAGQFGQGGASETASRLPREIAGLVWRIKAAASRSSIGSSSPKIPFEIGSAAG